ncbi:hypothetical protein Lser_V15G22453 [Lactuca serriola]
MNPNPFLLPICVTPLISYIHGIDPMRSTSADMESILCVTPGSPEGNCVDHQRFSILCVLLQMQMKYVEARLGDRVLYAERLTGSFKTTGYTMFFLEALLVPPTKFRPAAKAGDVVMENPQTVLLGKVLQSNISLGNAHINKLEGSKIVDRWRDLQQSVNVLFDSKTATIA